MITCFTGTGGSGKSLDAAREVYVTTRRYKKSVIANFEVNKDVLYRKCDTHGEFIYVKEDDLTVDYLYQYAYEHHFKKNPDGSYMLDKDGNFIMVGEAQTLIIIDECQRKFNPRDTSRKDRLKWVEFFCEHRHWGYNILLITPMTKLVDQQIMGCVEYEVRHRKLNNYAIFKLLPFACFAGIIYWHGVREKIDCYYFNYKKRYNGLYNTFKMFCIPDSIKQKIEQKEERVEEEEIIQTLSNSISPNDEQVTQEKPVVKQQTDSKKSALTWQQFCSVLTKKRYIFKKSK